MLGLALNFKAYAIIGIVIAILGSLSFTHYRAYQFGKDYILQKLADDKIKILRDGKEIDDEILNADDEALCILLGGC